MVLMAHTKAYDDKTQPESESELDSEEVFPNPSCSKLESCLSEILGNIRSFRKKQGSETSLSI